MKRINYHPIKSGLLFVGTTLCMMAFWSCSGSSSDPIDEPKDDGYVAPAAPEAINQTNVFAVDYFSQLTNEPLFSSADYTDVINYINTNKTSVSVFLDRSDHVVGQVSAAISIGLQTKTKSFFVQQNQDASRINGTGILVRPLVTTFEGFGIPDSLYLGGCMVAAPLGQPISLTPMTCALSDQYQFDLMVKNLGNGLRTNRIVIGTIKATLADLFENHLKYHLKDFRFKTFSSTKEGKTYKIFVLSPVQFVAREMKESMVGSSPLNQVKIEYLP